MFDARIPMVKLLFRTALVLWLLNYAPFAAVADDTPGSLWNIADLSEAPAATWGEKSGLVQEVFYESEPYRGHATRVFAYYARPAEGAGPWPAMVLVHGGGGEAFAEWAKLWAERGYVALAMDTAGHGPDGKRLADGGPDQDDNTKFRSFTAADVRQMWTYHAVAAAIRGHSLLAAQKDVDSRRIGITGISWGGYLTSIIAGVDHRLKVAVPVYGCGFLHDNSCWVEGHFAKMTPERRQLWVGSFDPSQYLGAVECPTLFVNGTNDFAYPLDSYQKSYRLVDKKLRHLCVKVRLPHGHSEGWSIPEIGLFVDSLLKDGQPLAKIGELQNVGSAVTSTAAAALPLNKAELHFTTDNGAWQKREWKSTPAKFAAGATSTTGHSYTLEAVLPETRPLVYFLTVSDERGAVSSSEHAELPAK